ncbi:hypothetical protein D9M68_955920 [compost metagenome]
MLAEGHDQPLDPRRDGLKAQTGAVAEHLALVIVHGDPGRELDELRQLFAVEHGQTLTRIEHERDTRDMQLLGVLQHGIAAIG